QTPSLRARYPPYESECNHKSLAPLVLPSHFHNYAPHYPVPLAKEDVHDSIGIPRKASRPPVYYLKQQNPSSSRFSFPPLPPWCRFSSLQLQLAYGDVLPQHGVPLPPLLQSPS